jgi:hypothetical protein
MLLDETLLEDDLVLALVILCLIVESSADRSFDLSDRTKDSNYKGPSD